MNKLNIAGRDYKPKYVIDMITRRGPVDPMFWEKRYGRPNNQNLAKFCEGYNESIESGVNKHLGPWSLAKSAIIRLNYPGSDPIAVWKESSSKNAAREYPSQKDAKFLADLTDKLRSVSTSGSDMGSVMMPKLNKIRLAEWDKVFGDKSPWKAIRGKKDKVVVQWDVEKAKKLGLEGK